MLSRMGSFTYEQGLSVYGEQVPMSDPRHYRTFRWGKDLQIWLVEGRDHRSPNFLPDGPDKSIWGSDLFPTFCEWAGVEINQKIDGSSLAPILSGKAKDLDRHVDSLLFHTPHYGRSQDAKPTTAIIAGDMKLIKHWETNSYSLFDLSEDIGEKKNLAGSQPEKLKKLITVMDKRLQAVNAQLPTRNPDYDPNAPLPEPRGPGGRGQGRPGGPRGGQNRTAGAAN